MRKIKLGPVKVEKNDKGLYCVQVKEPKETVSASGKTIEKARDLLASVVTIHRDLTTAVKIAEASVSEDGFRLGTEMYCCRSAIRKYIREFYPIVNVNLIGKSIMEAVHLREDGYDLVMTDLCHKIYKRVLFGEKKYNLSGDYTVQEMRTAQRDYHRIRLGREPVHHETDWFTSAYQLTRQS